MPAKSPQLRLAVAEAGGAARSGNATKIKEARQVLAAERIAAYIERVVAEAPPLSDAQRDRLASLLRGVAA